MNAQLFILSCLEMLISLLVAIGTITLTLRILKKRVMGKYNIQSDNLAFSIFSAGIIFSSGYLLSGASQPIINTLRQLNQAMNGAALAFDSVKYILLFILIGFLVAMGIILLTIKIYNALTPGINEVEEISKGHKGVAIIMAVIIVVISIFVREGYIQLLESLVPYPEVPSVF